MKSVVEAVHPEKKNEAEGGENEEESDGKKTWRERLAKKKDERRQTML